MIRVDHDFVVPGCVCSLSVGHKDVVFTQFEVSPDNQLLAFVGKDGYIPLVSNKVGQDC